MPDPAELAARLRALHVMDEVGSDNPLGRDAAELILQLVSDRDSWRNQASERVKDLDEMRKRAEAAEANYAGCTDTCSRLHSRIRTLEAENANLRRALQEMADAYRRTGLDMSPEGRAYLAKIDTLIGGDDA